MSTCGRWDCTTLGHFCIPVGIEIVPPSGTSVYLWALRLYHPQAPLYTRGHWNCTTLRRFCKPVGIEIVPPSGTSVYPWALRLYHPQALLYTRGHWDCTTLRHFCIPVGIEIVPPQALLYTCGHWDCTTLKHFCIAWGEGCTGVLKGGTISMPTSRHVDNDFIPGLRTKKSYILSGFSCSSCNVIVTFLYLWTKIP